MITLSRFLEMKYTIMKDIGLDKKEIAKEAMEDLIKTRKEMWLPGHLFKRKRTPVKISKEGKKALIIFFILYIIALALISIIIFNLIHQKIW